MGDAVGHVFAEATVGGGKIGELARPAGIHGKHLDLPEAVEERGVAGGDGVIEPIFLADGKVVAIGRYDKGADGVRIAEKSLRCQQQALGTLGVRMRLPWLGPVGVGGQGELRFGEPSIVAEITDQGRLVAVRDGKQLGAVFTGEARPQVRFGFDGELDPLLASQDPAGLGEVTDEQGVLAEEVLIVARRRRSTVADREELGPRGGEALPCCVVTPELGDVLPFKVSFV